MPTMNLPAAQETHYAMGTVMSHKAFGPRAGEALAAVISETARIEGLLSSFLPGSEISRINGSAGKKSEKVSADTFEVLSRAHAMSRDCSGCFDMTIAPLVKLWECAMESHTPPGSREIKQALARVNYLDLLLDPVERSAGLKAVGQSVNLGGIGKGYAGDRILEVFRKFGISSAYSNLGGNVVTLGAKPDGSPWQIGIQHPRQQGSLIGAVAVVGKTVVTSGDYQRYFVDCQGFRHHHILDPSTGYPSQSGLVSVTIITEKSILADVLSTAVFIAGLDMGLRLLRAYPDTEAVLVDTGLQVFATSGLRDCFQADAGVGINFQD